MKSVARIDLVSLPEQFGDENAGDILKTVDKLRELQIHRGNTEIGVNEAVLRFVVEKFPAGQPLRALDLPCGEAAFLGHLAELYPDSELLGADLRPPVSRPGMEFFAMDLAREFKIPAEKRFDLITCISGVMVFGNTQNFLENCVSRLKPNGILIVTNDNSMTMMDRLRYLFLGRVRMFNPVYENDEGVTQNIPIMELVRLLRLQGLEVEKLQYTSLHPRDFIYLPFALLIYPLHYLYLHKQKSLLGRAMRWQFYPFKHLLCRHYVIVCRKDATRA